MYKQEKIKIENRSKISILVGSIFLSRIKYLHLSNAANKCMTDYLFMHLDAV